MSITLASLREQKAARRACARYLQAIVDRLLLDSHDLDSLDLIGYDWSHTVGMDEVHLAGGTPITRLRCEVQFKGQFNPDDFFLEELGKVAKG